MLICQSKTYNSLKTKENMSVKAKPYAAPKVHERVLDLLKESQREPIGKILDLGAGEGALSALLNEMGFEVFACDISPNNFKLKNIQCKYCDLNSGVLPYEKEFFDYVICVEVIEHIENPYQLVRMTKLTLKDGGILIITTPNIMNINSRIRFAVRGWFSFFNENYDKHINPIPFWELKRILLKNNFVIKKITTNKFIKKSIKNIIFQVFYPVLQPKEKIILKGEDLIIKAKKKRLERENEQK